MSRSSAPCVLGLFVALASCSGDERALGPASGQTAPGAPLPALLHWPDASFLGRADGIDIAVVVSDAEA